MDPKNLTAWEVIEGLLIAFVAISGTVALNMGNTFIGVILLAPLIILSMLEIWKIPNKTLKEIHEKQKKTIMGKIMLFGELVTVVGFIVLAYQWAVK